MHRPLLLLLCLPLLGACLFREARPPPTRRIVQLAAETPPHPDGEQGLGETALLRLHGAEARLYGDAEGTRGWSLRGSILLEVLDRSGAVRARAMFGEATAQTVGLLWHREGRTRFGPGEVELTSLLQSSGDQPFRIRLEAAGATELSDLFLILAPPVPATAP